jgi:hypothetical protein
LRLLLLLLLRWRWRSWARHLRLLLLKVRQGCDDRRRLCWRLDLRWWWWCGRCGGWLLRRLRLRLRLSLCLKLG